MLLWLEMIHFSLGVCNGCQLMVKQNLFNRNNFNNNDNYYDNYNKKTLKLIRNDSKRFESRFVSVKVSQDNNIFFKDMKDMIFDI